VRTGVKVLRLGLEENEVHTLSTPKPLSQAEIWKAFDGLVTNAPSLRDLVKIA
jgi:hypothetical protein